MGFFGDSPENGCRFQGADEVVEGFLVAPPAAVLFNPLEIKFEGILSGFFGDSLRILENMDHFKVLMRLLKDFW